MWYRPIDARLVTVREPSAAAPFVEQTTVHIVVKRNGEDDDLGAVPPRMVPLVRALFELVRLVVRAETADTDRAREDMAARVYNRVREE
jgi:hypothetical protein